MGLPAGRTNNEKGRPQGSLNKVTSEMRNRIAVIIDNSYPTEKVIEIISTLEPKEQIQTYLSLVQFLVPKLRSIEADVNATGNFTLADLLKPMKNE